MKIYKDIDQGSLQWLQLRLFIPTASKFNEIISPKKLEYSASAKKYAYRLVAQKLLGRSLESLDGLEWVERGNEMEPDARRAYEFENDVTTERVGFITTDDGQIGCSPDSLVGDAGMAEFKCPAPQTMVAYAIAGLDDAYILQKQGQLLISEREWCDLYAFNPEMPTIKKRFYRDERIIAALTTGLRIFNEEKQMMLDKMLASGFFAEREKVQSVAQETYGEREKYDILEECLPPLPEEKPASGFPTPTLQDWLDDIAAAPTVEGVEFKYQAAIADNPYAADGFDVARDKRLAELSVLPAGQVMPGFIGKKGNEL